MIIVSILECLEYIMQQRAKGRNVLAQIKRKEKVRYNEYGITSHYVIMGEYQLIIMLAYY